MLIFCNRVYPGPAIMSSLFDISSSDQNPNILTPRKISFMSLFRKEAKQNSDFLSFFFLIRLSHLSR